VKTAGILAVAVLLLTEPKLPHWTPLTSGVTARLRGVSAVSEQVAWASGANGTILRTADGGATWQRFTIPDTAALDFRDVDAMSDRIAYVLSIGAGAASRIYKTIDAGAHWQLQFTNDEPKAFYDAMTFCDPQHGLAISDSVDGRFIVLRTSDGGAQWARIPSTSLPAALPNEGAFAASGSNIAMTDCAHAWIGTGSAARARVLRTADGGETWSVADTPLASATSSSIFSIAFRDERHGVVVGGDYKKESDAGRNAAATSDGGVTWRPVTGLGGFRSAVAHVPGTAASWIAIGPSGADVSDDDGQSWTSMPWGGFHAFAFARRAPIGWGVGESGRIGRLDWSSPAGHHAAALDARDEAPGNAGVIGRR
jgi:photosystem II stability/assembly factor-like uncharacterized protein